MSRRAQLALCAGGQTPRLRTFASHASSVDCAFLVPPTDSIVGKRFVLLKKELTPYHYPVKMKYLLPSNCSSRCSRQTGCSVFLPTPDALGNHQGLTLIELLVVIAIIAILAVILLPVSTTIRARSESAKSLANLRQSGSILLMATAESDNQLRIYSSGSGGDGSTLWAMQVARYILGDDANNITSTGRRIPALDIMYCPTVSPYRHDPANSTWTWHCFGAYAVSRGDYARSESIQLSSGGSYALYVVQMNNVPNPGNHPLLMDSIRAAGQTQHMTIRSHAPSASNGSVHLRHNGYARAVFLDGHVEELDGESLKEIGFTGGYSKDLQLIEF